MGSTGSSHGDRVVLTRRGRLVLTFTFLALVTVLALQTLPAGSSTPDPAAAGASSPPDGSTDGAGTPPDAASSDAPRSTAPDPSRAVTPPTSAPVADQPLVVNGRTQPPQVTVPTAASGDLTVVRGTTAAVTGSRVWTYRVELETGLPFEGDAFAAAVHATLSDPRGWRTSGNVFQRVDTDDADFRVILASPTLTDRLCAPLQTRGEVSCRNGDMVVLNALRWGVGIVDYAGDLASYREYLVNHEVGHRLGRGHVSCPGSGEPAPVMMQQTYGLDGCAPNSWPLPDE